MSTPRPPYDATAVRPAWDSLPSEVRDTVASWCGVPDSVTLAGGGFTGGFAATLVGEGAARAFVKAVSERNEPIAAAYRREIAVSRALPLGVPAPRLRHCAEVDVAGTGWVVLVFDHVDGWMPGMPWTPADLVVTVRTLERLADALGDVSWDGEGSLAHDAADESEQSLWDDLAPEAVAPDLRGWLSDHRRRLSAATALAPEAFQGDAWIHCDIRADNLVVGPERAWVVDWNWLIRAPAWVDLGLLLPQVHADGVDLAPALESPLLRGVAPAHLDAGLAWLAALLLRRAPEPPPFEASPWIRGHQQWFAEAALRLLADRWD